MSRFIKIIFPCIVVTAAALLVQGCVTSKKYKLAKTNTTATELDWNTSSAEATLTLKNLIVFKGPGSWKREARWDEYIVEFHNSGSEPFTIESAALIDVLGKPQLPGTDPWQLEKLSYTNWEKYGKSGLKLVAGAGVVILYTGAVVASAESAILAGGATAGGAAILDIVPVFALVDITTVAVMNHQHKVAVQTEFQKRRLILPLTVAPNGSVQGSLFYPMTPGPKRLVLAGHTQKNPIELTLELKPLASLHMKP